MRARLDQCRDKGFDGVEPDNIDGYTNDTGFPLTYADQIEHNKWLAAEAYQRELSIGLKNDPDQVADLLATFDWALLRRVHRHGHNHGPALPQATAMNLNAILKHRDLDAYREACPPSEGR